MDLFFFRDFILSFTFSYGKFQIFIKRGIISSFTSNFHFYLKFVIQINVIRMEAHFIELSFDQNSAT